jgi:hypothetical protein
MPEKSPNAWTWADVDDALAQMRRLELDVQEQATITEQCIAEAKAAYEEQRREADARIKALYAQIKAAWPGLRKTLGGGEKSMALPHGVVGTREVSSVKFDRGVDEPKAIALAEVAGFYDCIKVTKALLRDALKAKGPAALEKCGCHLASQDRFFAETDKLLTTVARRRTG